MVKYVHKNKDVANTKYMCRCGSYISVKGKEKHEHTETHKKTRDVEPPMENIDIFQDNYIFKSSARISNFEKATNLIKLLSKLLRYLLHPMGPI